jgi:hypothetical protein
MNSLCLSTGAGVMLVVTDFAKLECFEIVAVGFWISRI